MRYNMYFGYVTLFARYLGFSYLMVSFFIKKPNMFKILSSKNEPTELFVLPFMYDSLLRLTNNFFL